MSTDGLASVEDELYGVAPADFVAHRSAAARAAKERGDPDLAAAITALRKPTAAAWALDAFARARPAVVAELLEVGARLRDAVARGDGDVIRDLIRERTRTVTKVAREVRRHADVEGAPLSASVASQVEQTLRAATTSEDDGERLRRGVLAASLDESGLDALQFAATPRAAPGGGPGGGDPGGRGDGARRRQQGGGRGGGRATRVDRERRKALTRTVGAAERAVATAEDELSGVTAARRELEEERDELRRRLDDLDSRLRDARDRESGAERRLRDARAELRSARAELHRTDAAD